MFTIKTVSEGKTTLISVVSAEIITPDSEEWPDYTGGPLGEQAEEPRACVAFIYPSNRTGFNYLYGEDERAYIVNENGKTVASA